jgi:PKD domain/WD40-like Beta Propeller Repeat
MRKGPAILFFSFTAFLAGYTLSAQEAPAYKVTRLSLNTSSFSEISPVIIKDGIIFCSDRRVSGITDRTSFDNRRLYNIYIAEKKDTADWRKPVQVKSERSAQFNSGPLCVAPDGKTIYFTSEIETGVPSKNRKFKNHSGIFTGDLVGQELQSVRPFKYNNPDYNIGQPSISSDGKYLYFASDMPGGQGKSDIWYCESVNGEWSPPVNMGPQINSPGADNYPCIHPSGKLYFTSDRPGGMGGLDVYYSEKVNGSWDTPIRLAPPINSSSDDFAFYPQPDLQAGYFASNRRRNDDIYEFETTVIRKTYCNELEKNNYCYEFIEENAVKYDSIPFLYLWRFGDGTTAEGSRVEHCYKGPGTYLVQLDVTNEVTKNVTVNEKSQTLVVEDIVQPYISGPLTADAGIMITLSADSTNLPGWDISRYYWSFDDESIAIGKNVNKAYARPGVYSIQLIVTSKPGPDGAVKEACVSRKITIARTR